MNYHESARILRNSYEFLVRCWSGRRVASWEAETVVREAGVRTSAVAGQSSRGVIGINDSYLPPQGANRNSFHTRICFRILNGIL